MNSVYERSDRT
jgi:large subunit ribosomal protein L13e